MRLLLVVALLAATPALAQQDCGKITDCTPRTALISAFGAEADVYLAQMEQDGVHTLNGIRFTTGRLQGQDVVVALTNVSIPNAVMATQLMLDHFAIERIIMSGIAGGVNPDLHVGDVAVPARWALYQEMVFARQTDDGFAVPPFLEEDLVPHQDGGPVHFGMMFPSTIRLSTEGDPQFVEGEAGVQSAKHLWFPVDGGLLEAAGRLDVPLTDCLTAQGAADPTCVSEGAGRPPRLVVGGNGVSGSTFVDNADFRGWVFDAFAQGDERVHVLDMESAGTAFVAAANGVPFIAVRTVSDLAGGDVSLNVMPIFGGLAIANTSAVVLALLADL